VDQPVQQKIYQLIRIAVFFLFTGLSWQHWVYRNPPYDSLFEGLLQTGAPAGFHQMLAVVFLLGAVSVLLLHKKRYPARVLILLANLAIMVFGIADQVQKMPYYNQVVEHAIQFALPLLLLYFPKETLSKSWLLPAKVVIAATFTAHGLYALNWVPTPGHFIAMTHHVTGLDQSGSRTFLWIAGLLDLLLSVFIFFPGRIRQWALAYAVFWGLSTALARILGHVHLGWYEAAMYWVPEFIYRLGNAILPLALLVWYRERDAK
jgi:hypothetical protein